MTALQQLLYRPDWALHHVATFLQPVEATRLAIMARESGRWELERLVHWLLHGEAPFPPLDEKDVLFEAARLASWGTVQQLLQQIKCDVATQAVANTKANTKHGNDASAAAPWPQLTMAHAGSGVLFPPDVLIAAATRGDLAAVQWLLNRTAKGVNNVTFGDPRDGPTTVTPIPEDELDIINTALLTAAEARQLHVVDWLVHASPRIHCVLSLDDELRAVCWYTFEYEMYMYSCATMPYDMGYAVAPGTVASGDGIGELPSHMPLANMFARHGDVETLEKIYARANHRALFSPQAMESAIEGGHLHIVQWLHERFPSFLSPSCLPCASKHGYLHILEWLAPFHFRLSKSCFIDAAGEGHTEVLRWLRLQDESVFKVSSSEAVHQATKQGRREVVQFYHDEHGVDLASTVPEIISVCKSVETCEYILDHVIVTQGQLEQVLYYAAADSSLEVVQYLVSQRRLWTREAFEAAVYRCRSDRDRTRSKTENLISYETSKFLMSEARLRAKTLGTTLEDQVDLDNICIVQVAQMNNFETAEWLALSVPEADNDPSELLDANEYPLDGPALAIDAKPVVLACLRNRRNQCRSVTWLPRWAVVANCVEAFDRLVEMEHPSVGSLAVQRAIIEHSRDGRFMVKLMAHMHGGTLSTDIVTWGSSYGMRSVVQRVYANEAVAKRQRVLQLVVTKGAENGHVGILEWALAKCTTDRLPKVIVFNEAASASAREDHVAVLKWLHHQDLLPFSDADALAAVVREASRRRSMDSLQWLTRTFTVRANVIAQILLDAVKRDHDDVVRCLALKYAPHDLRISAADRARVRALLVKRQV